jgi:hypothetical protein
VKARLGGLGKLRGARDGTLYDEAGMIVRNLRVRSVREVVVRNIWLVERVLVCFGTLIWWLRHRGGPAVYRPRCVRRERPPVGP